MKKSPTASEVLVAFRQMMASHADLSNVNLSFVGEKDALDHIVWDFEAEYRAMQKEGDVGIDAAIQRYSDKIGLHPDWLVYLPLILKENE